ncbi:MAG: FAD-binding protein [Bacteroidia bacterium]|nr:MAG: FAD-binding protein [Bacteroidia bacterium]PIE86218.1 MAG: FAD-binding protein [Bacteroidia bacterium]
MQKNIQLVLSPKQASDSDFYLPIAARKLKIDENQINHHQIIKKSIDARQKYVKINLELFIVWNDPDYKCENKKTLYPNVKNRTSVIIIGSGPAGLFAALTLIQHEIRPIIFERGKSVSERKIDIAELNKNRRLNPESNYCFGEGGAGTFSDGKLYTRAKKRGNIQQILEILHRHGADEKILYETQAHIGTNKLPNIIRKIRETILNAGGEIHFNAKLTDLLIEKNSVRGIEINNTEQFAASDVILATGHSARDVYHLLHKKNISLEAKTFAAGVRIEHPQALIDSIQYHTQEKRSQYLPAASYKLKRQVENRGVYSFCMCPGGFIIPSATAEGEMLVNGMSPSGRNSPYANSGIVVEIRPDDLPEYKKYGALAGLKFQQDLEALAYNNKGKGQQAPAQRMADFVNNKLSADLPKNSYIPGLISSPLHFWLPEIISSRLKAAFVGFGKSMKGYLTNHALVVGVESRTSSPVRIPRDAKTLEHTDIKGLYPVGEGSGYAGGITSSAIDGVNTAHAIAQKITKQHCL